MTIWKFSFVDVWDICLDSASIQDLDEDDCSKKIVFSGDIGNKNKPLIRSPQYIRQADYVVMEVLAAVGSTEYPGDHVENLPA